MCCLSLNISIKCLDILNVTIKMRRKKDILHYDDLSLVVPQRTGEIKIKYIIIATLIIVFKVSA